MACHSTAPTASVRSVDGSPVPHHGRGEACALVVPARPENVNENRTSATLTSSWMRMRRLKEKRDAAAASGELLANDLTDARAVGASCDLWHHIGHDATEVGHARGAHLRDRIVDD